MATVGTLGGNPGMNGPGALTGPLPTWHSEATAEDRQRMTAAIYTIFQNKRPQALVQNNKLPEFVKRLEDALYRNAKSKEEYTDVSTLEARLHDVAKRFVKPAGAQQQQAPQQQAPQQQPQQPPGGLFPGPAGPQQGVPQTTLAPGPTPGMMNMGMQGLGMPQQQFQMPQGQPVPNQGFMPNPGGMPGTMGMPDLRQDQLRNQMQVPVPGMAPHGMMPTQPMPGMDPNQQFKPQLMGAPNNPGFNPTQAMPQGVMSNGAPVLIRGQGREWNNQTPQMLGTGVPPQGMNNLTINGMMPGQLASGPGMMPNQPSMAQSGFIPNNTAPAPNGMIPMNNGMNGMVPMNPGPLSSSPLLNSMNKFNGPSPGQPGGLQGMVPVGGVNPSGNMPGMMPMGNTGAGFPGAGGGLSLQTGPSATPSAMPAMPSSVTGLPEGLSPEQQQQYVQKQQRWLLFLRHCAKCRAPGDECQLKTQCKFGKQLWSHILTCSDVACQYPRCSSSKDLLKHHQKCQAAQCPICAPVKDYVKKTRQQTVQQQQLQPPQPVGSFIGQPPGGMLPNGMVGQQQVMPAANGLAGQKRPHGLMDGPGSMGAGPMGGMPAGMVPVPGGMGMGMGMGDSMQAQQQAVPQGPVAPQQAPQQRMPPQQMPQQPGGMPGAMGQGPMPKRPKGEDVLSQNAGTSLLETFTAQQIKVHQDLIKSAAVTQRNAQPPPANPEDACKVCQLTKLSFEPPVIYCSACGSKIKRGQIFYSTPPENGNDLKGYFCHTCFSDCKGDRIHVEGVPIKKTDLAKRKNDEEIEEGWVQCDHCEGWVHQICGLFNKGRNNNDVHYLCPDCLVDGCKSGQRRPTEVRPQAMLEAKDLPTSKLSDWITERLNRELEKERIKRAQMQGKEPHEVQGPEPLTVRMINSIMKKCEVKPKFYETFGAENNYAEAFPYRQKVLLLFQSLDGVDVCLFCMYVQEYGRECAAPNTNVVYLSYLDSVKYFRPEIPCALGPNVSLRTFVYHQLLIGYLEFVRYLGFEQMYIWACPPMQGDDYILYCHPSKQKTPRSDRLRAWYLEMLKLAKEEGVVVHLSTLWDTYFEGGRDHRMERCSVTYIPYMEGDYWPGEAENQLATLTDASKAGNKGPKGGAGLGRKGGSKGKRYGGGPATTDEQLMARISEILGGNMREDFIVVHMQQPCTFCRCHVRGPNLVYRYRVPPGATPPKAAPERKFEGIKLEGGGPSVPAGTVTSLTICEGCFQDEETRRALGQQQRLPAGVSTADLHREKVEPVPMWDRDPDGDMESEFFETRQTFLSLCQGNHYQFDTLRRAKHSSMMVLYHLHNPQSPAFASSCNTCNAEIEPGMGFRCTVCPDFDMCASCKINVGHPHPVVPHKRALDETRQRLTDAERRERNEQLQKTLALLVHACSCHNQQCTSSSCRKVKQLFQHAVHCQAKVTGGCQLCKKMWCLLNLHAKGCTNSNCPVPRCKELKELRRRQNNRQEEKRRAAYQAMLRQQHMTGQPGRPV